MLEKNDTDDAFEYERDRRFATDTVCDESSSAEELRQCTERTRENMNQTLNELEEKISPAGLWARVRRMFFNSDGAEFDLERTVSRNPALYTAIGSGLVLLGAGMTVYAFSKMQRKPAVGRIPDRQPSAELDRSPEDFFVPPHDAEPAVTPRPEYASSTQILEEEASTEEIQRQVLEKAAQEKNSESMAPA
ncbi:MAG: hypothetical protein WAK95_21210 [Desulfobacterales bacterium]